MSTKEKVYVDTNIWRKIIYGEIKVAQLKKFELYSSLLVVHELCTSEGLKNESSNKNVRDALRLFDKHITGNRFLDTFHYQHLLKISNILYKPDYIEIFKIRWREFAYDNSYDHNFYWSLLIHIVERDIELWVSGIRKKLMDLHERVIRSEKNSVIKEKNKYTNGLALEHTIWREYTLLILLSPNYFNINQIKWDEIDLYLKVRTEHLRQCVFGSRKFDMNTEYDIRHLMYVQPGMKFLSDDKKFKILVGETGMKNYILDL